MNICLLIFCTLLAALTIWNLIQGQRQQKKNDAENRKREEERSERPLRLVLFGKRLVPQDDITMREVVQLSILCSHAACGVYEKPFLDFIRTHGLERHFQDEGGSHG
jgi:hypothetical protein